MRTKQSILVVTYFFPPSCTAEAICTANIISSLSELGYDITVVTSDNPAQLSDFEYRNLVHKNINVIIAPDYNRTGNPRINKFKRMVTLVPDVGSLWIKQAVKAGITAARDNKYSILYSRSMPGSSAIAALQIKEKTLMPWIAHFSDPWPFADYINRPAIHDYLLNKYFIRILNEADGISFTCEACSNYIKIRYKGLTKESKYFITSHIGKMIDSEDIEDQVPRTQFNLVHTGSFYGLRTPWTLMEGFAEFVRKCKGAIEAKLTLIGPSKWDLRAKAQELGISENVEVMGELSLVNTQKNMRKASALVIVEADLNKPLFLPSKLAEYALLNKPIIALTPEGSPTRGFLYDDPDASCVTPSNASALAEILSGVSERSNISASESKNIALHTKMRKAFSKESVLKNLITCIDSLI